MSELRIAQLETRVSSLEGRVDTIHSIYRDTLDTLTKAQRDIEQIKNMLISNKLTLWERIRGRK